MPIRSGCYGGPIGRTPGRGRAYRAAARDPIRSIPSTMASSSICWAGGRRRRSCSASWSTTRRACSASDRPSGQGNEVLVALVGALELEESVVAAAVAVRVAAADRGPRLVHGAAALLLVEQHAGRLEHRVLLVTQELRLLLGVVLGKALLRVLVADVEVLRQALDVARRHFDLRVAAAIAGALEAGIALRHSSVSYEKRGILRKS